MTGIYALYADPDAALRAVDGLRATGLNDSQITLVSSEPLEHHPLGERDKATWMFWIAGAGGAIGLATAAWLTRMTELAWPLSTGNMPIVSWWTNLIVIFELTMLGAIVATVITLLVAAGLPSRRTLYDPEVSGGRVLVGVERPASKSVPQIERALLAAGGSVKTI